MTLNTFLHNKCILFLDIKGTTKELKFFAAKDDSIVTDT